MQYVDLESERLDEGVKDVLSSVASLFKKNNVQKLRTKYMKKGESRIFATEDTRGKVHVSIFDGSKKVQEKSFSNINQADEFLEGFKREGYEVATKPNAYKQAGTWLGSVAGVSLALMNSFDVGVAGGFIISSLLSAGGIAGVTLLGAGIALTVNFAIAAGGWMIADISKKKRSELNKERNAIEINESAPPTKAAEEWIQKNKERFKKQYGDDWEEIMYATAWKMHKNGNL